MSYQVFFTDSNLKYLALHRMGNKSKDEGIFPSRSLLNFADPDLKREIHEYLISHFKFESIYQFGHTTDLSLNEAYNYCSQIFDNPDEADVFFEESIHLLKYLYECSSHSKINDGELYVAYFEGIVVEDEMLDAIGIFKVETKNRFLKLNLDEESNWSLIFDEGTNIENLDKGCLVFNTQREEGFRVISVDMKSTDAKYWRDEFLMLTQIHDNNFYTKAYLNLCKEFGKTHFEKEEKQEQINFLNKTIEYFNSAEEFNFEELAEELFEENVQKRESFQEYKNDFKEKEGLLPEEESFFIAAPVVKKAEKSFKKIIQLDSHIEIKINSAKAQKDGLVEKGFDAEKGMYYYKLYYNDEN
jgi:hypothetical protein